MTLEQLVQEVSVDWVTNPDWDESEVYVKVRGEVTTLPEPAAVERVFAAMGFSWFGPEKRTGARVRRFEGRRGAAKLTCILEAGIVRQGRRIRGDEVTFEWVTHERPPLEGHEAVV